METDLERFFAGPPPRDLASAPPQVHAWRNGAKWGRRIPAILGGLISVGVGFAVGDGVAAQVGGAIGLGLCLSVPFAVWAEVVGRRQDRLLREAPLVVLRVVRSVERDLGEGGEVVMVRTFRLRAQEPATGEYTFGLASALVPEGFEQEGVVVGLAAPQGAFVTVGGLLLKAARVS